MYHITYLCTHVPHLHHMYIYDMSILLVLVLLIHVLHSLSHVLALVSCLHVLVLCLLLWVLVLVSLSLVLVVSSCTCLLSLLLSPHVRVGVVMLLVYHTTHTSIHPTYHHIHYYHYLLPATATPRGSGWRVQVLKHQGRQATTPILQLVMGM